MFFLGYFSAFFINILYMIYEVLINIVIFLFL